MVVQFYSWFKFYFHCFKVIYHFTIPKNNRKIRFKPRINLNHYIRISLVILSLFFFFHSVVGAGYTYASSCKILLKNKTPKKYIMGRKIICNDANSTQVKKFNWWLCFLPPYIYQPKLWQSEKSKMNYNMRKRSLKNAEGNLLICFLHGLFGSYARNVNVGVHRINSCS